MILEIAQLQVRQGQTKEFEASFAIAQKIIASMPGYLGYELHKCIEQDHHYMLLVRWESVEHHEIGFRKSSEYQKWRKLLHHFPLCCTTQQFIELHTRFVFVALLTAGVGQ